MTLESAQTRAVTHFRSSLAGQAFDVELDAKAAHLADAFARREAHDHPHGDLRFSVRIDREEAEAALQGLTSGSVHQRQGDVHAWRVTQPRHVQWLAPDPVTNKQSAVATLILEQADLLDGGLRARPGADAISAWAATKGIYPIHASCIAMSGRALLMLGDGGSGKTTTALALAERGWSLIADDRCFIYREGAKAKVASLYATAIVTQDSLARLQARDWEDLGITCHGKYARRLPASIDVASEAELAGVVWVSPTVGQLYQPSVLDRQQALVPWQAAFAPALQTHGPSADWFRHLAALSRSAPAWRMRLGWDFDRVDAALRGLIL